MKKKIFSLVTITALAVATVLGSGSAFANSQNQDFSKMPKMEHNIENAVLGKITAIDANSVTIALATRSNIMKKDMQKPNDNGTTPPEKPNESNGLTKNNNGTRSEKPNMDDMFTLTGETKTISLAGTTFEKKQMPQNNENGTNNSTQNTKQTSTYSDFAVGDYVNIEMTDATSNIAKTVREAGGFMGGEGGPKGNGQGFGGSKNKNQNQ